MFWKLRNKWNSSLYNYLLMWFGQWIRDVRFVWRNSFVRIAAYWSSSRHLGTLRVLWKWLNVVKHFLKFICWMSVFWQYIGLGCHILKLLLWVFIFYEFLCDPIICPNNNRTSCVLELSRLWYVELGQSLTNEFAFLLRIFFWKYLRELWPNWAFIRGLIWSRP